MSTKVALHALSALLVIAFLVVLFSARAALIVGGVVAICVVAVVADAARKPAIHERKS